MVATLSRTANFALSIFLLLVFLSAFSAAADADDVCEAEESPVLNTSAPNCEVPGNPDFYGLGVRLGVYFAWLTSWTANNFLPNEMSSSFDTNSIFLLAISVTVIFFSLKYALFIIDALVLLQLSFGFAFSVMSLWGYRTMWYKREGVDGKKHFGGWGTHCRLALCIGISGYSLWFWTRGLSGGLPQCYMRDECGGLSTFIFTKISIHGPIRTAYIVVSAACCMFYGVMTLVAMAAALSHVWCWWKGYEREWIPQDLDGNDGLDARELTISYIALSTFNFLWILFSAVTVEFTLNFNHVSRVLGGRGIIGAGQLLPMFVGMFSFVRVLYLLFKDYVVVERLEGRKERQERNLRGLGMTGTTLAESPETPSTLSKRPRTSTGRKTRYSLWHRIITAWLPWLSCFEWWRRQGHSSSFHLLSTGKNSYSSTPAMLGQPADVEMRESMVTTPPSHVVDVDTAYHSNGRLAAR